MKVAVLTLTRDRLEYTKHCFENLHIYAGCKFDHYVLDQASVDGTKEWLRRYFEGEFFLGSENVGINAGMEFLTRHIADSDYDVIVKFDNDCELTQPYTLKTVCKLAQYSDALLSPRIVGLNRPPPVIGQWWQGPFEILEIPQIGGIFMAIPRSVFDQGFQYDRSKLLDDDVDLCWWWRGKGGRCGYVKGLEANHYETTKGQWERYPDYFLRTLLEGKSAL